MSPPDFDEGDPDPLLAEVEEGEVAALLPTTLLLTAGGEDWPCGVNGDEDAVT